MLKLDYCHLMGLLMIKQRKPHCILQCNKKGAILDENRNDESMEFFAWNGFKKVNLKHKPSSCLRKKRFHFIKFQWEDIQASVAWSIIWSPPWQFHAVIFFIFAFSYYHLSIVMCENWTFLSSQASPTYFIRSHHYIPQFVLLPLA